MAACKRRARDFLSAGPGMIGEPSGPLPDRASLLQGSGREDLSFPRLEKGAAQGFPIPGDRRGFPGGRNARRAAIPNSWERNEKRPLLVQRTRLLRMDRLVIRAGVRPGARISSALLDSSLVPSSISLVRTRPPASHRRARDKWDRHMLLPMHGGLPPMIPRRREVESGTETC